MTKDEVILMAHVAGVVDFLYSNPDLQDAYEFLQRFVTLVATAERQPLTEEHIYRLYSNAMRGYWVESFHHWRLKKRNEAHEFARAIEAAHGIGSTHG